MKFGLISCVKNKVNHKCKAKDLYVSDLFIKSKTYAERNYDKYYILSALHGLVDPEEEVEPYEFTLIGQSSNFKKQWSSNVFHQIINVINIESEIYIHAGNEYRKFLLPLLEEEGFECHVPLQGLGIGQQKAWYKKVLGE